MNINDLIRTHYDAGERDPDAITASVVAEVLASDNPAALLRPVVSWYTTGHLRSLVRALERHVDLRPSTVEWTNPATEARDRLLKEAVWVPGIGRVPWGKLTIEHHERVIDHYRITIYGYQQTVAKHEEAIQIIKAHPGAMCLDDCDRQEATVT